MASQKNNPGRNAEEVKLDADGFPDVSGWSEEQVGFAPYWSPDAGAKIFATPIMKDMRDPAFVRYLFLALKDTRCSSGPVETAEEVIVKKGEIFTCSAYVALQDVLEFYMMSKVPVEALIECVDKQSGGKASKGDFWKFRVFVSPQQRELLNAAKSKLGLPPGPLPRDMGARADAQLEKERALPSAS